MTVVDVNTGKFTGAGGNLEETVTKNNLEAAEEIVRQLRLRDIGGIIVVDFIDMVLESNRELVLRRLLECLGRDRTKHQVAEVTSLGLVQMTRKRVGQGLLEVFSETCELRRPRGHPARRAGREAASGRRAGPAARRRGRRLQRAATATAAAPATRHDAAAGARRRERRRRAAAGAAGSRLRSSGVRRGGGGTRRGLGGRSRAASRLATAVGEPALPRGLTAAASR